MASSAAIDALVAAGLTSSKADIEFLASELKKRETLSPLAAPALAPAPAPADGLKLIVCDEDPGFFRCACLAFHSPLLSCVDVQLGMLTDCQCDCLIHPGNSGVDWTTPAGGIGLEMMRFGPHYSHALMQAFALERVRFSGEEHVTCPMLKTARVVPTGHDRLPRWAVYVACFAGPHRLAQRPELCMSPQEALLAALRAVMAHNAVARPADRIFTIATPNLGRCYFRDLRGPALERAFLPSAPMVEAGTLEELSEEEATAAGMVTSSAWAEMFSALYLRREMSSDLNGYISFLAHANPAKMQLIAPKLQLVAEHLITEEFRVYKAAQSDAWPMANAVLIALDEWTCALAESRRADERTTTRDIPCAVARPRCRAPLAA